MSKWFSLLLLLPLFFIFSFTLSRPASAEEAFSPSYVATYTVDESGMTHAVLAISLTNTTTEQMATSYKMSVGFNNISRITAHDKSGPLIPVISKIKDGGYDLEFNFNDKVAGKGKTLTFVLAFDTSEIAEKNGNNWEIHIPGVARQAEFSDYTIQVQVPDSFGKPALIKPSIPGDTLIFHKKDLGTSGIVILFGTEQLYSFDLHYRLKNDHVYSVTSEIALPPTTNYQDIELTSVQPRPMSVKQDMDGNWLASFSLPPHSTHEIQVKGFASVSFTPRKEVLTQTQQQIYLAETPYWQVSDPQIQKLAQQLKTPQAIYDYVVEHLNYDIHRVTDVAERAGAVGVLHNPSSAVCLEFTDLFIALSRSAGIPAREVDGYAYTSNSRVWPLSLVKDVLHAWPEYYDAQKQQWIMVDPTWGKTTDGIDYFHSLDFDHVAFVVKGIDSSMPLPAGLYKLAGEEKKKDVQINFVTAVPKQKSDLHVIPDNTQQYLSGVAVQPIVTIKNTGISQSSPELAFITTSTLFPSEQYIAIPPVPPLGEIQVVVPFARTGFLTNQNHTFTILLADRKVDQRIRVAPIIYTRWTLRGGIVLVLSAIIISFLAYQAWRVPIFRRKK